MNEEIYTDMVTVLSTAPFVTGGPVKKEVLILVKSTFYCFRINIMFCLQSVLKKYTCMYLTFVFFFTFENKS